MLRKIILDGVEKGHTDGVEKGHTDGVEKGILSPPAHDAIAVKQCDAWAKEAMECVVIRGRRNL
jgi:hypothetical protein